MGFSGLDVSPNLQPFPSNPPPIKSVKRKLRGRTSLRPVLCRNTQGQKGGPDLGFLPGKTRLMAKIKAPKARTLKITTLKELPTNKKARKTT
jgi:hypothetical protein